MPSTNRFFPPCDGWRTLWCSIDIFVSDADAWLPMATMRSKSNSRSRRAMKRSPIASSAAVGARFESGSPAWKGWKGNAFQSSGRGRMSRMVDQTIVALASVDSRGPAVALR